MKYLGKIESPKDLVTAEWTENKIEQRNDQTYYGPSAPTENKYGFWVKTVE